MSKHFYKCPECGYKNYLTKEDVDKRKAKLLHAREEKLERDDSRWFGENIKRSIRFFKNLKKHCGR